MKLESISQVFEYLRDGYGYSEAIADCLNAHNLGLSTLEAHFSTWLWLPDGVTEDEAYPTEADKQYARELGRIEELLTMNGLIYKD